MATQNSINQGDSTRIFSGVQSWGGAGDYFDDTTLGSFTVSRAGTGYVNGKPVSWAGSQTVTGLTAGNTYYIYIDGDGVIGKTTSRDTAFNGNYIPLFECLRDSTSPTNNQVTVREDHTYKMAIYTSEYLHDSIGSIIENLNNGANITLNGTQKIQINGTDYLSDHGLETTISDSGGVAVSFHKKYTDGSGKWAMQNNSDTFSGYYNNAGTPTVLGGSKFGVYTLYASKDNLNSSTPTYFAVLDTSQYNSLTLANNAIANGTTAKATNELAALELVQLGYIIFSQSANSIVQVIISKSTLRSSYTTGGTNTASLINTVTTNFDGILSATNTNVQSALETIDDWGKTTTDHSLIIGNGTGSALGSLGVASDGQLPIGSTGADPTLATLTAGVGVTVTNGAGSITVASTTTTGNTQTDSYALVIGDAGKLIIMNKGTANTLTVPKNSSVAFATGTIVQVVQYGAGATTIAPVDGDVTLRSANSLLTLYGQYSLASMVKIGTDEWIVSGDLT